jgi:hypothetical protein
MSVCMRFLHLREYIYVLATVEVVVCDGDEGFGFLLYPRKYNIHSSLWLVFNYSSSLFLELAFFKFTMHNNNNKHLKIRQYPETIADVETRTFALWAVKFR